MSAVPNTADQRLICGWNATFLWSFEILTNR